jgi:spermidine synthase
MGESVELSPIIIDVAKAYFECPHSDNWQLIEADIRDYIEVCPNKYDLIVIDIAIDKKTPDWLLSPEFLNHCRKTLTQRGHVSINLIVKGDEDFINALAVIRQAFDKQTLCLSLSLSLSEHRNILVFAYNTLPSYSTEQLIDRAEQLRAVWQVEFTDFYRQMTKDNPQGSGVI